MLGQKAKFLLSIFGPILNFERFLIWQQLTYADTLTTVNY